MTRKRTTVSLSDQVLERIHESGVRNVSRYLENLAKKDLAQQHHEGARESQKVKQWEAELDEVEKEWFALQESRGEA